MCERFSLALTKQKIARRYTVDVGQYPGIRYSIAPGEPVAVVTGVNPGELAVFDWGITVPGKNFGRPYAAVDAHTVRTRPYWLERLQTQRCLIPADGFYLWKKVNRKSKVPFRVILQWNMPFAFAGLWQSATDAEGNERKTCAIITVEANPLLRPVSPQMPLIIPLEHEKTWLDSTQSIDSLTALLAPFPADRMKVFPVSPDINQPSNNTERVTLPAPPMDQFGNYILFTDL